GLDARKACIEERSVVGNYVSTAEVRLTTQTGPDRRPNATVGGGFRNSFGGCCEDAEMPRALILGHPARRPALLYDGSHSWPGLLPF
ncbi:MAG: hypothetical protein GX934_02710, partial [Burkholderiales bacterium]|nr:hypothetical protein [Burkholderiales bacterium]